MIVPENIIVSAKAEGISEEEIISVVEDCLKTKKIVFLESENAYVCHKQLDNIVLWVRFLHGEKDISGSENDNDITIDSGFIVEEYYYNRTIETGSKDATETELKNKSPFLNPYLDKSLICVKCDCKLVLKKILFKYLSQNYHSVGLVCPVCGQVFENAEMVEYQRDKIEKVLEWK